MLMRTREETLKQYIENYDINEPMQYSSEWERILDTAYEFCEQQLKERLKL